MHQAANERSLVDHTYDEWVGAELNHAETVRVNGHLPTLVRGRNA